MLMIKLCLRTNIQRTTRICTPNSWTTRPTADVDNRLSPNCMQGRRTKKPRSKGKGMAPTAPATIHRSPPLSQRPASDAIGIDVMNYDTILQGWTSHYINQLLVSRKEIANSRPPPDVIEEAQTLQARYKRRKKLLTLAGHTTEKALEAEMYIILHLNLLLIPLTLTNSLY